MVTESGVGAEISIAEVVWRREASQSENVAKTSPLDPPSACSV